MGPHPNDQSEVTKLLSGLERLNVAPEDEVQEQLLACCGSRRWAEEMVARRPFSAFENLDTTARAIWWALAREDWMEAFRSHPEIGRKQPETPTSAWSEQEQSGLLNADREVKQALHELNAIYRERFGYIFIICATGKSSEEMLAILRQRLDNDPVTELRIAAEEQAKITTLRLHKLLNR